jgi:hypothetical protein
MEDFAAEVAEASKSLKAARDQVELAFKENEKAVVTYFRSKLEPFLTSLAKDLIGHGIIATPKTNTKHKSAIFEVMDFRFVFQGTYTSELNGLTVTTWDNQTVSLMTEKIQQIASLPPEKAGRFIVDQLCEAAQKVPVREDNVRKMEFS